MLDKNLNNAILLGIYEASVHLLKKNIEFVSKLGLTNQQWVIMIHLAKDPSLPYLIRESHEKPIMANELADSLGVTRANVTTLVKALIQKNLVVQIEDKEDRRKKRLMLTDSGKSLIKDIQPERLSSNENMLKGFSQEEKEQFLKYIQKCTTNVLNINSELSN